MIRRLLIVFGLALALSGQSFLPSGAPPAGSCGSTWCADSVNGSDASACTGTGSNACQTIGHLLSLVGSSANQTIGLAKGSYWREQFLLGTQGSPINGTTIAAYGSGATPILDGADVFANATFTLNSGIVYQHAITIGSGSSANFPKCYENWSAGNNPLTFQTSIANVQATPGSYYIPSVATNNGQAPGGADTVYISASNSSNVITNGKTYECEQRSFGLSLAGGGTLTVNGIEARRASAHDGVMPIYNTGTATLTGVIARLGGFHNMLVEPGATLNQPQLIDGYLFGSYGAPSLLVVFHSGSSTSAGYTVNGGGTASGTAATFTNNITNGAIPLGMLVHTDGTGMGAGLINAVKITAPAAFDGLSTEGAESSYTVQNSYFNNLRNAISTSDASTTISGNQSISTYTNHSHVLVPTAGLTVAITNNLFCSAFGNVGSVQHGMVYITANSTITYTGNKSYTGQTTFPGDQNVAHIKSSGAGAASITRNSNFFDEAPGADFYEFYDSAVSPAGDNNTWDGFGNSRNGTTYATLVSWQTAFSIDAHSTAPVSSNPGATACTPPA